MLFGKPKKDDTEEKPLSSSVSAKNSTIKLSGKKRDNTGIVLENKNSNVSVELKLSGRSKSFFFSDSFLDSASKMAVKKASLKALEVEEEQEEEIPTEMPVIESNQCVVELFAELKPLILRDLGCSSSINLC